MSRDATGFSPEFLHAVVDEIARVHRALDRLDRRIETAKRPATKERISAGRARWEAYEQKLRALLK